MSAVKRVVKSVQPQVPFIEPTPEERLVQIEEDLRSNVRYAEKNLDEWKARFEKDPSNAFSWASSSFVQAARKNIAECLLAWIKFGREREDDYVKASPEKIIAEVHRTLRDEVMRNAKWPEHSTSATSNEMSLCLMAQRAEWCEKLERVIERMERKS
jgi:hypothetical protein